MCACVHTAFPCSSLPGRHPRSGRRDVRQGVCRGRVGARRARGCARFGGAGGESGGGAPLRGCRSGGECGEPCPPPLRWRKGRRRLPGVALPPPPAAPSSLSPKRAARASGSGGGLGFPAGGRLACEPQGGGLPAEAGTLRTAGRWERWGRGGVGARGAGVRVPGARLEWRWRPWLPPPPPCWYGRFLIMCSGRRRREPASAPARTGAPASARSRSRRAAAGAALPAPGVNGCAAAERVNEARRRGKRRRRRRRRRCGDWDAPWSPAARSLWAVLETLPLPRPPPPLPLPTWFQSCAQAGPAGGREGGRTGGARGEAVAEPGVSASACAYVFVCARGRGAARAVAMGREPPLWPLG
ncbi:hypothetical protein HPG69_008752 [Diceros bicornis minor]|uniref:Uncharacterized protein n=1 Tax=Diceros bicornis minor TaxID=77932 RepID=A0A7J7FAK4_DICBM|nr:hypothetical protein HPG69_008752 [Diceros bicornis minor]